MTSTDTRSPVSWRVHVARLPDKGMPVTWAADEESRAALAAEHGLEAVDAFAVDLLVTRWKKDGVRVTGTVTADIVQLCVVTLDPLKNHIEEEINAVFVPEGSRLARMEDPSGEILVDAEGEDAPEPFAGDSVDVGALAEEHFELAIDPYPRKPDAHLPQDVEPQPEDKPNPFAKLAVLKGDKPK
ncbi:metal-binding protein [Zhengella mangrovi]|uniref:Metal-binding protein n=1 Tax=Zhengella mangrovi TaxID=1982044 RepID=A0A2G1QMW7_9HYPH|nr:DUF177 domain-containing protein [Zhengella mangrovi]PHP66887.1 metal-binding protein [Zhengella mangrovi]